MRVVLPPSFLKPSLGQAQQSACACPQPQPREAWQDMMTVASVVLLAINILKVIK